MFKLCEKKKKKIQYYSTHLWCKRVRYKHAIQKKTEGRGLGRKSSERPGCCDIHTNQMGFLTATE